MRRGLQSRIAGIFGAAQAADSFTEIGSSNLVLLVSKLEFLGIQEVLLVPQLRYGIAIKHPLRGDRIEGLTDFDNRRVNPRIILQRHDQVVHGLEYIRAG